MENRHLISNAFLAFYTELARIKAVLLSPHPQLLLPEKLRARPEGTEDSGVDYNQLAAYLSRQLEGYILKQRKKVEEACTALELKTYQQGEYVMVALADELFILEIAWPGADHWHRYLLEHRLYASDASGQKFFTRLEALLHDKSQDLLLKDLAAVYLFAIRMGFAGRYRGRSRYQDLDKYQRALLTFIGHTGTDLPLFKQSYGHTLNEGVSLRLAPLAPWKKGAVLVFLVYILASYWVWSSSVSELTDVTRDLTSLPSSVPATATTTPQVAATPDLPAGTL
jgi:type VI secretion system protein ImpK